jgi:hypothetical protein
VEALFAQALLEQSARSGSSEAPSSQQSTGTREELRTGSGKPASGGRE